MKLASHSRGFTLIEILISMVLGIMVVSALAAVVQKMSDAKAGLEEREQITESAHFAMTQMVRAIRESRDLILPQQDKTVTNWRDNVREETVPASPPEGTSTKATAVLAVSLGASVDLDADGFPDADNDRDGLIDEDYPDDINFDLSPGIYLIDDGGDGSVDEGTGNAADDDERISLSDEDPINGLDDDGDGVADEDPGADMNGDGAPGIAGVDDDGDGLIDEGAAGDDDEDGKSDEDWLDTVVYFLRGDALIERHPVPWDEDNGGAVSGRDYVESSIADGVSRFRVERVASSGGVEIVDITLELTGPNDDTVSLQTRVRVGATQ